MERIMAAAIVDLDINEGDTFIMTMELWENQDNTIPIDVSADTFTGSFKIGNKTIPMRVVLLGPTVNVLEATVDYTNMADLSRTGKYDIDQLTQYGERFRLIQGNVRVSQEVTT